MTSVLVTLLSFPIHTCNSVYRHSSPSTGRVDLCTHTYLSHLYITNNPQIRPCIRKAQHVVHTSRYVAFSILTCIAKEGKMTKRKYIIITDLHILRDLAIRQIEGRSTLKYISIDTYQRLIIQLDRQKTGRQQIVHTI